MSVDGGRGRLLAGGWCCVGGAGELPEGGRLCVCGLGDVCTGGLPFDAVRPDPTGEGVCGR